MVFEYADGSYPVITGGPLQNAKYRFVEVHHHFGENRKIGSEHTIDGVSYAAEAHLIFFNTKYASFNEAKANTDGLTVLVRMFLVTELQKTRYGFVPYLKKVKKYQQTYTIKSSKSFSLSSILGTWGGSYYSYHGSLTTPNCEESVLWMILNRPLPFYYLEIQEYRKCKGFDGNKIAPNIRPIQSTNNREIDYYSS